MASLAHLLASRVFQLGGEWAVADACVGLGDADHALDGARAEAKPRQGAARQGDELVTNG